MWRGVFWREQDTLRVESLRCVGVRGLNQIFRRGVWDSGKHSQGAACV